MTISGLSSALAGLRTAQQQLELISSNVANVGTEGYTRKTVAQQTVTVDGQAVGLTTSPAMRNVDLRLERDFWTQVSKVSFHDVQAGFLNEIQSFHGGATQEISIAAKVAALKNKFAALAETPEDAFLQKGVVNQAVDVANKINDFANLLTQMRNDAQDEMSVSIGKINDQLERIAEFNRQIKTAAASGKSTATLEDSRDRAARELSAEMEIKFYIRADGVMVVQSAEGVVLAEDRAQTLYFDKTRLGPTSTYPGSASGVYIGGNPALNPNSFDATSSQLGGRLGALVSARDELLPQQQAMLDELAHKLAMRMDMQGLRLFTDAGGNVPPDTAPNPGTQTPVPYVGFSSVIRVNAEIIRDNSLVQKGTVATDLPVQSGASTVPRRIVEFAFGNVAYQQAAGTVDLRASGGPATLQEWLGIYSQNQIKSTTNIAAYADIPALLTAGNMTAGPDQFTITFEELRTTPPLGPTPVTIDLSDAAANHPIDGVTIKDALDQIIAEINAQITAEGVDAGLAAVATRNSNGQLLIQSRGTIHVDSSAPGGMGAENLAFLGLEEGEYKPSDPYIDIQVGDESPVRITILPGEDETDLVAKLEKTGVGDDGVPGLAVTLDPLTGFLSLRPGDVASNPRFGGDIKIFGGGFTADGTGAAGGIAAGTTIVAALFGNDAPVTDVAYGSATSLPGVTVPFRSTELGARASLGTGVTGDNLVDFAQKIVNRQSEEVNRIESLRDSDAAYRDLLQKQLMDESGVNLDEELSHMIVVQTAFAAAARIISSIDEQFKQLLQVI